MKIGDIMILNERQRHPGLVGALFIVEEPRNWGACGYVQGNPANTGEIIPLRVNHDEMHATGGNIAEWMDP